MEKQELNQTRAAKPKKKKGKRDIKQLIALILLFIVGLSILLYPTVSNLWNQQFANMLIKQYDEQVAKGDPKEYDTMIEHAKAYNKQIGKEAVPDAFAVRDGIRDKNYEAMLNISDNGMMGYVEIPAIGVKVPIYHYTTEKVLEKGAGHLLGSSLPVGGKGSHSVISAHRGLPSMKLFTDLNLLKKGDKFFYTILNKHIAYEIDQILTVKPKNTKALAIDQEKDLSTLVTCTPYGVNSHRLLVRGHRVPYVPEDKDVQNRSSWIRDLPLWAVIVAAIIGLAIGILIVWMMNKRRKKKNDALTGQDSDTLKENAPTAQNSGSSEESTSTMQSAGSVIDTKNGNSDGNER